MRRIVMEVKISIKNSEGFPETCIENAMTGDQCPMLYDKGLFGNQSVCSLFDLNKVLERRKMEGDSPGCNTGFLIPHKKCLEMREGGSVTAVDLVKVTKFKIVVNEVDSVVNNLCEVVDCLELNALDRADIAKSLFELQLKMLDLKNMV